MIIAGCGYTGQRLARALVADGEDVLCLTGREARRDALAKSGLTALAWNIDALAPAPDLPAGRAVAYLVPPPRVGTTDTRLARFLAALPDHPSRLVYASTTGVYGNRDGARVDEDTEPRPQTDRARRRLDAERRIREWCAAADVPWVVLRVPGIYGPGRLQLATVETARPMLHPDQAGPGNRIHVDDLVRCLKAALRTGEVDGVYNVGDGDHTNNTAFVTEVARQLGRPAPPLASRERIRAEADPRRWSFLRESRQVDTARMRRILGVESIYADHRDGIAASLAEMGRG